MHSFKFAFLTLGKAMAIHEMLSWRLKIRVVANRFWEDGGRKTMDCVSIMLKHKQATLLDLMTAFKR